MSLIINPYVFKTLVNISFVGSATGANTATMPAHQAGDLIIIAAYNVPSTTAPTLLSGYLNIASQSGTANSYRYMRKLATSSGETIPTISNCTICSVAVYRGTSQTSPIGATQTGGGTSSTATYPAVTMQVNDGSSWVVVLAEATTASSTLETPPTGTTLRTNRVDAASEVAIFDSAGGVAAWASKTAALGVSASYRNICIEIRAS